MKNSWKHFNNFTLDINLLPFKVTPAIILIQKFSPTKSVEFVLYKLKCEREKYKFNYANCSNYVLSLNNVT